MASVTDGWGGDSIPTGQPTGGRAVIMQVTVMDTDMGIIMATDVVTSPVTKLGRVIFGVGAGVLTIVIRVFGGFPEGVCYSILLMNAVTPLIDRYTVRIHQPTLDEGLVQEEGSAPER